MLPWRRARLAADGCLKIAVTNPASSPAHYPVKELKGAGFKARMVQNVIDSDATLIVYFCDLEGGTQNTVFNCINRRKPCKLIDAAEITTARAAELAEAFVRKHSVQRLNVAGPRASKQPDAYRYTYDMVNALIERLRSVAT
jgi:hypothetical protein